MQARNCNTQLLLPSLYGDRWVGLNGIMFSGSGNIKNTIITSWRSVKLKVKEGKIPRAG
jgi:hypothetical protein